MDLRVARAAQTSAIEKVRRMPYQAGGAAFAVEVGSWVPHPLLFKGADFGLDFDRYFFPSAESMVINLALFIVRPTAPQPLAIAPDSKS